MYGHLITRFKLCFSLITETMIRLFKVKEKQKETAENAKENGLVKKQSAGELLFIEVNMILGCIYVMICCNVVQSYTLTCILVPKYTFNSNI
ncbi:hypothetical protein DVH24_031500 [Malus domestica]|uniref:Uncharacterized protein n=1 Tax=Malus domestica TaxID=3750 RepID=A0A498HIF1_MALDO|nr:hypothetical protein DVH24_031500 [Malus domestica]